MEEGDECVFFCFLFFQEGFLLAVINFREVKKERSRDANATP